MQAREPEQRVRVRCPHVGKLPQFTHRSHQRVEFDPPPTWLLACDTAGGEDVAQKPWKSVVGKQPGTRKAIQRLYMDQLAQFLSFLHRQKYVNKLANEVGLRESTKLPLRDAL